MSAADQLKAFIAKFDAKDQRLIRAARSAMRKRLPTAHELVYDNYNFFVIGYSPSERPSDALFSIAARANAVSLCFLHGVQLPDPKKLLHGAGTQTRFVRLDSAERLAHPPRRSTRRRGYRTGQAAAADAQPWKTDHPVDFRQAAAASPPGGPLASLEKPWWPTSCTTGRSTSRVFEAVSGGPRRRRECLARVTSTSSGSAPSSTVSRATAGRCTCESCGDFSSMMRSCRMTCDWTCRMTVERPQR